MKRLLSILVASFLLASFPLITRAANTPADWTASPSPFDADAPVTMTADGDGTRIKALNDAFFTYNHKTDPQDTGMKVRINTLPGYAQGGKPKPQINGLSMVIAVKNVTTRADYGTKDSFKGAMFYVEFNSQNEYKVIPYLIGLGGDNWAEQTASYPPDPSGQVTDGCTIDFRFSLTGSTLSASVNGQTILNLPSSGLSEADFADGMYLQAGMHASANAGQMDFTVLSAAEKPPWIIAESPGAGGSNPATMTADGAGWRFAGVTASSATWNETVDPENTNVAIRLDSIPGYITSAGDTGKPVVGGTGLAVALKDNKNVAAGYGGRNDGTFLILYLYFNSPTELGVVPYIAGTNEAQSNWVGLTPVNLTVPVKEGGELTLQFCQTGRRVTAWVNGRLACDAQSAEAANLNLSGGAYLQAGMECSAFTMCGFTVLRINDQSLLDWRGAVNAVQEENRTRVAGATQSYIEHTIPIRPDAGARSASLVIAPEEVPCYSGVVSGAHQDASSSYSMIFSQPNSDGTNSGIIIRFLPETEETSYLQVVRLNHGAEDAWPYAVQNRPAPFVAGEKYFISLKEIDGHWRVALNGETLPLTNGTDETVFDGYLSGAEVYLTLRVDVADSANNSGLPFAYSIYDFAPELGVKAYGELGASGAELPEASSLLIVNDTAGDASAAVIAASYAGGAMTSADTLLNDSGIASGAVRRVELVAQKPGETRRVYVWDSPERMRPINML